MIQIQGTQLIGVIVTFLEMMAPLKNLFFIVYTVYIYSSLFDSICNYSYIHSECQGNYQFTGAPIVGGGRMIGWICRIYIYI